MVDHETFHFHCLVVRMLKMILYILTYPDFRSADTKAKHNIEKLQSDASSFLKEFSNFP